MGVMQDYQPALSTPIPAGMNDPVGGTSLGSGFTAAVTVQQIGGQQESPEGVLGATLVGPSPEELVAIGQAPVTTGILADLRSVEANLSLIVGAGVAALDHLLLDEAKGLLERMPQSFPSAPAPAGSSSSSSGGGSGFQLLGALALLSILLLGGKHLWPAREFIKPSSALLPIIERPG
jgi:hypothetical protein